jgi:hypothetical protein
MGREIDSQEREGPEHTAEVRSESPRRIESRDRRRYAELDRSGALRVSDRERETLHDIGSFRTLAAADLARERYGGRASEMEQDLRSLREQGLLRRHSVWVESGKEKVTVLALTPRGKHLIERDGNSSGQVVYAGFVKPAEVGHDTAIYRMYQAEAARIEAAGGRIRRVVLDYELKRKVYSPLAKVRPLGSADYAKEQARVAEQQGLRVTRGNICLPDLRIEFETPGGELGRVDLELATKQYRGSHLQEKAEAGFKLYAAEGAASRLSAALDEREITADILSL